MDNELWVDPTPEPRRAMFAVHVVWMLWLLGVRAMFGVTGREITPVWSALLASRSTNHPIRAIHARRESGAAFAAIGSWAHTGLPAGIFTTTGPGITNALTALEAGRMAGAKLIFVTPITPVENRDRLPIQATGPSGYFSLDVHVPGRLFDVVELIESPAQLAPLAGRLATGLTGPGPFLAHIAIPAPLQEQIVELAPVLPLRRRSVASLDPAEADHLVEQLQRKRHVVWVGRGARQDAPAIRRMLDLTGAPVMCAPGGLGIADRHEQFIGSTGNGGRRSTIEAFLRYAPEIVLVLGTPMDQASSSWLPELVPPGGFIHVDTDETMFGRAYPQAKTVGIQAEVGAVVEAILARSHRLVRRKSHARIVKPPRLALVPADERPIHPATVMDAIQRVVLDATTIPVLADPASSMFWAAHYLVFDDPERWFVEDAWGAVGTAVAAVVGFALGSEGGALAIVGDHAMQAEDEINTAVANGIHAIWLVLNDSGMGIVEHGMAKDGWPNRETAFPPTDFAAVAVAKGAKGQRVTCAENLDDVLREAIAADGPFVIDVVIDPTVPAPIDARTGKR